MPRRHPRTYQRKRARPSYEGEQGEWPGAHMRKRSTPTDYRPLIAVIGLVIFGLAAIAFLLTLRSHG